MVFVVGLFIVMGGFALLMILWMVNSGIYLYTCKRVLDTDLPIYPQETWTLNPIKSWQTQMLYHRLLTTPQVDPDLEQLRKRANRFFVWALIWAPAGMVVLFITGVIGTFV